MNATSWQTFITAQINLHKLQCLGEVVHSFEETEAFTAVHCLTESHISIHTWPEYNLCTCDVFLSNFKNNNNTITKTISKNIIDFFECTDYDIQETER